MVYRSNWKVITGTWLVKVFFFPCVVGWWFFFFSFNSKIRFQMDQRAPVRLVIVQCNPRMELAGTFW